MVKPSPLFEGDQDNSTEIKEARESAPELVRKLGLSTGMVKPSSFSEGAGEFSTMFRRSKQIPLAVCVRSCCG